MLKQQITAQRDTALPCCALVGDTCVLAQGCSWPDPRRGETEGQDQCRAARSYYVCCKAHLLPYYKHLSLSLQTKDNAFELGQWSLWWHQ